MNILVCIKQVPDNAVAPKLDLATGRVVKEGIETMISPFDQNAIEAAMQLVEAHGGEVSVMTVGDEACKNALKIGVAMGAEQAYLVNDPALEGSDGWATAYVLAKAIQSVGPFDLIFCGKQAIDSDAAQVGAGIAEQMNIAQITHVNEIRGVTADSITARRVTPNGEEVIEAKLPALITCEKSLNEPRYPTLKRTRKANRMEFPLLDCAAIGVDLAKVGANSPSVTKRLYTPAPRQSGEVVKGEAAEIGKRAVGKIMDLKIV